MSSTPLRGDMTLKDVAGLLGEAYLRDGQDTAHFQVALDVADGRKLVVSVAMRIDPVQDFSGMLPGVNR